jgi:hypothetical protein
MRRRRRNDIVARVGIIAEAVVSCASTVKDRSLRFWLTRQHSGHIQPRSGLFRKPQPRTTSDRRCDVLFATISSGAVKNVRFATRKVTNGGIVSHVKPIHRVTCADCVAYQPVRWERGRLSTQLDVTAQCGYVRSVRPAIAARRAVLVICRHQHPHRPRLGIPRNITPCPKEN